MMIFSGFLFGLTNSSEPQDIQFSIKDDYDNQKIFTNEDLELRE